MHDNINIYIFWRKKVLTEIVFTFAFLPSMVFSSNSSPRTKFISELLNVDTVFIVHLSPSTVMI